MRHTLRICCLLVTLATCSLSAQNAPGYVFRILQVPGNHEFVQAHGINNLGHIVGELDSDGVRHGYVLTSPTTLTYIDHPGDGITGVSYTRPSGINDHGSIVGWWAAGSFPFDEHGFLYKSGTFQTIAFPGAAITVPYGINNSGIVVGYYSVATGPGSFAPRGFVFDGTTYTSIDVPGAQRTSLIGISNDGKVVGRYELNGNSVGFAASGGSFKVLGTSSVPLFPLGINVSGRIIGGFSSPDQTESHGFLYNRRYFLFDCRGSLPFNGPEGINDRNVVVGSCGDDNGAPRAYYAYERR